VVAARIPLLALRAWMKRGSHASPQRERGNPYCVPNKAAAILVHIADEQAQVARRQLADRRQAAGRPAKPVRGRQSISKVSAKSRRENDDLHFKKPWKQGVFASTFFTKRRGRDSFGTVLYGLGISAISVAMSMPVNDL
jgi:hypothetical protein